MKKLTKLQLSQLNSFSEIENNFKLNEYLGLKTSMYFDIWKDGCFLIEAKQNIGSTSNGLSKAKKELEQYKEKLKFLGLKLPKLRLILDYDKKELYDENGGFYQKLSDFDFDVKESYENYDITFSNGANIAQQIYSRYKHKKINDSNIFKIFSEGIDWYNPTHLNENDFRLTLDLFNDPITQKKRGAFYTPDDYIEISTNYVRKAIEESKEEGFKDYVILDTCAGSGQLEKMFTDEELGHCVLSTLGIAEWISLWNTYGDKVKEIIPPYIKGKTIDQLTSPEDLKNQIDIDANLIKGADAISQQFTENILKKIAAWKEEGKAIIMLENPPYLELNSKV